MKLDHINIRAPRELLEREKAFFCEVLGLHEGPRPGFGNYGYWLYADDDAVVHLSESSAPLDDDAQGCFNHVAFRSSGLQDLIRSLERAGIRHSVSFLEDRDMTQVFFRAPSNTRIEVNFIGEKV